MRSDNLRFVIRFRRLCHIANLIAGILFVALLAAPSLRAEEVTIKHNGLTLNADLHLAEGKSIEDGVVLMTHAMLQHNRMEIMRVVTELFREHGYSTLSMTYSAGLDDRRGPYDCATPHRHSMDGHLEEIGLWIDWLKQRGAGEIILTGHSGGANKIMHLLTRAEALPVRRTVLFAPGTADHFSRTVEGYRARYRKDVEPILETARSLVEAGQGDTLMDDIDFAFCARATVSARTFLSYYDPADRSHRHMPNQLKSMTKKRIATLIVAASEDNIAPHMASIIEPYATGDPIRLVTLEGCGHFFRDLCADDAVEAAVKFLEETAAAVAEK